MTVNPLLKPTALPLVTPQQDILTFSSTSAKLLAQDSRIYYWNTLSFIADEIEEYVPENKRKENI